MNPRETPQRAIEEFADAVARYYLNLQQNGTAADSVDSIDQFVSAVELDLRSTLRSRVRRVMRADSVENAPTVDLSSMDDDSEAGILSGDIVAGVSDDATLVTNANVVSANDNTIDARNAMIRGDALTLDSRHVTNGPSGNGLASHPHSLPAGYDFIEVLGRGGMGVVFKARHVPLKRTVAVKMIISGNRASADQVKRFQREAESAAHLKHPNIVSVYEVGQHNGLPYFSLEYVEGKTVAEQLREHTLTPTQAANLLIPVANAVDYSHQMGVLHRDLKPQNILMTPDGVPKVADFGLAKRLDLESTDAEQTREGIVVGTPGYMAPEQITRSGDVGPQSDVYSLGCILYYILTGRPPFAAPTPFETVQQVMQSEPVRPSRFQNNLDRDIETICLKALEKDADRRYQSAAELADDLQRFVDGKPIEARAVAPPERFWKWCKRNPRLATACAIAASLLLCLTIGGIGSAIIINQQRQAEAFARREAEANEVIADEQAELALETTRAILYETKGFFADKPELIPLRKRMLDEIMQRVERIHTERYTNDVETTFAASGEAQLGEYYLIAGQYEKALDKLSQAEQKLRSLNADGTLHRANVSQMHLTLGMGDALQKLGRLEEAEQQYLSLLDQRRSFFRDASQQDLKIYEGGDIAQVYGKLAGLYRELGQPDKELEFQQQSVAQRRHDHENAPDRLSFTEHLASALMALSQTHERAGRFDSMLSASTESLRLQSDVAERRSDAATLHNTGIKQKAVARQCLLRGKTDETRTLIQQAHKSLVKASEQLPDDNRVLGALIDLHYWHGVITDQCGDDPTESYQQAEELQRDRLKNSDSVNNRGMLLKILARAGKVTDAEKIANRLAKNPDDLMGSGYVACGYTLMTDHAEAGSAEQSRLIDIAIEWTRRLIQNGYHDLESLRTTDLDFAPLQSNADYLAMILAEEERLSESE